MGAAYALVARMIRIILLWFLLAFLSCAGLLVLLNPDGSSFPLRCDPFENLVNLIVELLSGLCLAASSASHRLTLPPL